LPLEFEIKTGSIWVLESKAMKLRAGLLLLLVTWPSVFGQQDYQDAFEEDGGADAPPPALHV
jgi:hypothetical protein